MPSVEQLRNRLLKKLSELFQLDQPDLDFGFYRIMHAKAQEVQAFIGTDLLKIVADAFGDVDEARKAELQAAYDNIVREAEEEYGSTEPEKTPKALKARAALDAVKDTASAEADVYNHLYRFFERYYDDGDFISRRYYTRETAGKAAPFAVPYNGEEVKLHWANADQYYIKSTEYFSNFTFDITQSAEIRQMSKAERALNHIPDRTLKVHFRVVEATEGEHGNIKASEANKRFFILHKEKPVTLTETGELVVNFEYRPDPEKTGQEKRNAEAVDNLLKALEKYDPQITQIDADEKPKKKIGENLRKSAEDYLCLFKVPAPTDSDPGRPLLAKYVNQYTARNTRDYFIHKDLGGFLRRELDFYIKNEVMRLDDIENAEAPAVESYLVKIKVLRKIAGKLIDFLAQLEDFQKKLWLKKKFIIETNYCITLDRVPEELYPLIVESEEQIREWVKLGFIEEKSPHITQKSADLFGGNLRESAPSADSISVEVLKANNKLVLDTRFFDDSFKALLVASIENFDEQCDGLLIHSENFQALNTIKERLCKQVSYIYIDPPYNTNEASFIYKNEYKHSSWGSMVGNSINAGQKLLSSDGVISIAIDDLEQPFLASICDGIFGMERRLGTLVVEIKPSGRTNDNFFATSHEYLLFYGVNAAGANISFFPLTEDQKAQYAESDDNSAFKWRDFLRTGGYSTPEERPNSFYPIYFSEESGDITLAEKEGYTKILPMDSEGRFRVWRKTPPSFLDHLRVGEIKITKNRAGQIKVQIIDRIKTGTRPKSVWIGKQYDAASHGTKLLKQIFGDTSPFTFPKSIHSVYDCVYIAAGDPDCDHTILDYFAGSGTTGHAVINLNRTDGGSRKYVLIEMGDYFDTVIRPRICKAVYSVNWKDGKPTARDSGISHCFKYIRLESYEDTLNNLRFNDEPGKSTLLNNPSLKEDYMLRYLLDVETRGSQSLLNIDAFVDPTAYTLEVKKPGTDEYVTRAVDLIETFNYLIGLRVVHYAAPQEFTARFRRVEDPEMPTDQKTKLVLDGNMKQINPQMNADLEDPKNNLRKSAKSADKYWWFRKVEGWVPEDPANPNNGQQEKVLIVWRKLTGDIEQDNLMLNEWFEKNRISTSGSSFDTIYVNGSNNLPNLKQDDENWKVRLIEEEFMKRMWDVEGL